MRLAAGIVGVEGEQIEGGRGKTVQVVVPRRLDVRVPPGRDTVDMEVCREMAAKDPEKFAKWMSTRPVKLEPGKTEPPDGKGKGANSREQIIAHAAKEYRDGEGATITDEITWINGALREAAKSPLTDDEKSKLDAA